MNEQTEIMEQPVNPPVAVNDVPVSARSPEVRTSAVITPQAGCATCGGSEGPTGLSPNGGGTVSYVYAIGRVEARFPNLAAEKAFAQATGRTDTAGKTDQETFHTVLSRRENRYLIRQLCWVLTIQIQGLETYLLQSCRSGMLFMPEISMVKYEMIIDFPTVVPSSNVEMSGNDKTIARPACWNINNATHQAG